MGNAKIIKTVRTKAVNKCDRKRSKTIDKKLRRATQVRITH